MSEPKPLVAAIDYETFYSKEYSIRDLGNWAYCHHPLFDPYMLTVATDRGDKWFGDPLDFQFENVDGAIWIMANAGFDTTVTETLQEQGRIFNAKPAAIYDVLDLARYLGYPGNLAGAAEHMLGKKLNKGVRDAAKGKKWRDMTQARRDEMSAYAMADANVTLEIWLKYGHLWPEWERKLSDLTRRMCREGLPVDLAGIETDIQSLETLLWKVRTQIPWKIEEDGKGALSKKSMAEECRKNGILPPKSMAKDSEEFDGWLRVHGENFAWARAMGSYRSINGQLKRLRSMKARTIDNEDGTGRMVYGLKYAGAHTLRDSGDAGVNVQNFARDFMFEKELREAAGVSASIDPETGKFHEEPDKHYGIDMRGKIAAPKGFKLGVVDLSAIEPCCLAVLSGDEELAQLLRDGMDVYEGQARLDGEYDDPRPLKDVDKRLRQFNKVKVLGCGYGAGPDKVQVIAKTMVGITLTIEETRALVFKFRSRKFIPGLWTDLETAMRFETGRDFTMGLPSGRDMLYRDVKNYGKLSAVIPRGGKMMRLTFWGGTLTENLVQATARDVFMDRVLALSEAGMPPILRVHDEAVCLLREETAEEQLQQMISIMSTTPEWMPELPLSASGHLCDRYTKD